MTDLRKAAEQALEALHNIDQSNNDDAIEALRQALAQPESYKWEPAIEHIYNPNGTLQSIRVKMTPQSDWVDYEPLKREWIGLTKEEAKEISMANRPYVIDMIAALEAKLKEKNT